MFSEKKESDIFRRVTDRTLFQDRVLAVLPTHFTENSLSFLGQRIERNKNYKYSLHPLELSPFHI